MNALQAVLAAHEPVTDYRGDYLGCLCRYNLPGLPVQPHAEHVAEALATHLLSEPVVAVASLVFAGEPGDDVPPRMRAALTTIIEGRP